MTRATDKTEVYLSVRDWIGLAGLGVTVSIVCWSASVNIASRISAIETQIRNLEARQAITDQALIFGKMPQRPPQFSDATQ